ELGETDGPEEIDLELGPYRIQRYVLHGTDDTVPGVVDQNPDRTVVGVDPLDRGPHGLLIADVQVQRVDPRRREVGQVTTRSVRGVHGVAGAVQAPGHG